MIKFEKGTLVKSRSGRRYGEVGKVDGSSICPGMWPIKFSDGEVYLMDEEDFVPAMTGDCLPPYDKDDEIPLDDEEDDIPLNTHTGQSYHDEHYFGSIEPLELMQAQMTSEAFKGFLRGNIIKYVSRMGKKDPEEKEATKVLRYAQWLLKVTKGETINPATDKL